MDSFHKSEDSLSRERIEFINSQVSTSDDSDDTEQEAAAPRTWGNPRSTWNTPQRNESWNNPRSNWNTPQRNSTEQSPWRLNAPARPQNLPRVLPKSQEKRPLTTPEKHQTDPKRNKPAEEGSRAEKTKEDETSKAKPNEAPKPIVDSLPAPRQISMITEQANIASQAVMNITDTIAENTEIEKSTKNKIKKELIKILEAIHALQASATVLNTPQQSRERIPLQGSYAEKLKLSTSKIPKKLPEPQPVILIYPTASTPDQTSEQTKEKVKEAINPVEGGWQIAGIRKIRNGGIALRTSKECGRNVIQLKNSIEQKGMIIKEPTKLKPTVIIKNVPNELTPAEIQAAIKNQNFPEIPIEVIAKEIKPVFGIRRRNGTTSNWVVEVTPRARNGILQQGKLYIDYRVCPVEDYQRITRCYNCQKFGHPAAKCNRTKVCSICSQEGHSHKECQIKEDQAKCGNCKALNQPHNHSVRNLKCPYYQRLLAERRQRTDYIGTEISA